MFSRRRVILIFAAAAVLAPASIALSVLEAPGLPVRIVTYVVYVLSAIFFGLSISLIVRFAKRLIPRLAELAHRTKFTGQIVDDYAFRTIVIGYGSLAVNIFFALTKAAAGWYASSVWHFALALYYLILCVTKALVLRRGRKRIPGETPTARLRREWKIYRMCGILLVCMTLTLQGIIILIIEQGNTFTYQGTLIYAAALYDFYCLMARSKLVEANEKIAEKVTTGFQGMSDGVTSVFQKMCDTVVGSYTKIEDGFVDRYLTKEGEAVEDAKKRLADERAAHEAAKSN